MDAAKVCTGAGEDVSKQRLERWTFGTSVCKDSPVAPTCLHVPLWAVESHCRLLQRRGTQSACLRKVFLAATWRLRMQEDQEAMGGDGE